VNLTMEMLRRIGRPLGVCHVARMRQRLATTMPAVGPKPALKLAGQQSGGSMNSFPSRVETRPRPEDAAEIRACFFSGWKG